MSTEHQKWCDIFYSALVDTVLDNQTYIDEINASGNYAPLLEVILEDGKCPAIHKKYFNLCTEVDDDKLFDGFEWDGLCGSITIPVKDSPKIYNIRSIMIKSTEEKGVAFHPVIRYCVVEGDDEKLSDIVRQAREKALAERRSMCM